MTYTRLLLNNIKEYTPYFLKTIPYKNATGPIHRIKVNRAWNWTQQKNVKGTFRFINKYFYGNMPGQFIIYFAFTYAITNAIFVPFLGLYRMNNKHRSLDEAIKIEKAFQLAQEEAEDDDDDEEDDEE